MVYEIIMEADDAKVAFVDTEKGETTGNEISQSMSKNPTIDKFKGDNRSLSSGQNSKPEVTVQAKNGQEAEAKIKDMMNKNPEVNNMVRNNKVDVVVQRESVRRTVKQLDESTKITLTKDSFKKYALWKR